MAATDGRQTHWGFAWRRRLSACGVMRLTSVSATVSPDEFPRPTGVTRFLAQFASTSRAEALHLALQALSARVEPDRVLGCELAWEVHTHSYWSQVQRSNG